MTSFLRWYSRLLQTNPIRTQCLTSGILMATGDIIAQTVIEKRLSNKFEPVRVLRFAALGTCFVGPILRIWYLKLEKIFGPSGSTTGLKKMLTDQIVFVPCFVGSFLTVTGVLQLQPWHKIKEKLNKDYFEILKTNYMVWPATQLVTFYIVPLNYRIIFVSFIALFWNTYLTSKTSSDV